MNFFKKSFRQYFMKLNGPMNITTKAHNLQITLACFPACSNIRANGRVYSCSIGYGSSSRLRSETFQPAVFEPFGF